MKKDLKFLLKQFLFRYMKYYFGVIPAQKHLPEPPASIVLLAQERFGDVIMLTPLIRELRQRYPEAEIVVICVSRVAEFLKYDPNIDEIYNIKKAPRKLQKKLLKRRFDLLFNTKDHPSTIFLYLSRKMNARYRVGLAHPLHQGYFHYLLPVENDSLMIKKNCALLDFLKLPCQASEEIPRIPPGPITPEVKQFAAEIARQKAIGINLSTSKAYRQWPLAHWRKFLRQVEQPVIIFAMPEQKAEKQLLEKEFTHVLAAPDTRTLFDAGHLIQQLCLLLSPDTALIHVASCFNIPVIAFYRTEFDIKRFAPLSDKQRVFLAPEENIKNITPEEVLEAYQTFRNDVNP